MRRRPACLPFCQRPLTRTCPLTVPPHIPCSIRYNRIGDEGASALAAVLKETKISHLECAAAQYSVRFCVSAPLTSLRPHCIDSTLIPVLSLEDNILTKEANNRRSKTPRAAVSASTSSKRPRCTVPPSDAPWRARLANRAVSPASPSPTARRPPPALGAASRGTSSNASNSTRILLVRGNIRVENMKCGWMRASGECCSLHSTVLVSGAPY